jgi:hypothetical protein
MRAPGRLPSLLHGVAAPGILLPMPASLAAVLPCSVAPAVHFMVGFSAEALCLCGTLSPARGGGIQLEMGATHVITQGLCVTLCFFGMQGPPFPGRAD